MLTRFMSYGAGCLALAVLLAAVAGCPEKKAAETDTAAPADTAASADTEKAAKSDAEVQSEVEAKLAKADLLDGKADKIVTRCAGCALKMDGSSEHTLKVKDYTLYFCREECAKTFAEDTTKAVLALEIPEA